MPVPAASGTKVLAGGVAVPVGARTPGAFLCKPWTTPAKEWEALIPPEVAGGALGLLVVSLGL